MTRAKAVRILKSKTPKTSEELLRAIKRLGSSQKEIKTNLIKLGFKNSDQRNCVTCPVCKYLESLGLKSPYVSDSEIIVRTNGDRLVCDLTYYPVMKRFQVKAGQGMIKGLAGYVGPYLRVGTP